MTSWAIVVAAGSGTRFGGTKQFADVGGRRVIDRSVEAAAVATDGVVLVIAEDHRSDIGPVPADHIVTGGETRSASVRAGLAAVPHDADIVVVHDAARPLANSHLFASVIDAVRSGADGAIPGVAVVDTIKRVDADSAGNQGMTVVETVDRDQLVAIQTPQAFKAKVLRRAHASAPEGSDDAGAVEDLGGVVRVVPGDVANVKITRPIDLDLVRLLVQQ